MKGRTWRKRKAKLERRENSQNNKVLDTDYIILLRWAKKNGARFPKLHPALFNDTGRGIMASRKFKAGEEIISLPENLLITCSSVLKGTLGIYIRDFKLTLSPRQKLCIFVIYEYCLGEESFWCPYIRSLPKSFNTPACFTRKELRYLPESCKKKAEEQINEVKRAFKGAKGFWTYLLTSHTGADQNLQDSLAKAFTFETFSWAWFVINTRSVYMDHGIDSKSLEHDTYALAPVLDLLNHTSNVQVEAGFDARTKCYQIKTLIGCNKGAQIFINYGPHDNQTLLVEYGFILTDNLNSKVYIPKDNVFSLLKNRNCVHMKKKLAILERNHLLQDFYCTHEGLSWNVLVTLRILALTGTELLHWEKALCGCAVSESSENLVNNWTISLLTDCLKTYLRQEGELLVDVESDNFSYNIEVSKSLINQEKMILDATLKKYKEVVSKRSLDF